MARQGVTLMCYWNGRVTSGAHGISYEGATPKPIRVSYGITYNELLDKIYGVTGFDKHQFKLKITCRYPACREYIPVPIDDDESIDIMFDVARQPGTNCMELYLERVSKPIENQVNVTVPAERVSVPIENHVNVTVPAHTNKQTPVEKEATHDAQVDSFLDPGPVDNTVLVLQNQHRSAAIWAGEDPGVLTCRQRLATMMREWQLDSRIRRFVIQSGFYGAYRIGFIQIDWPLVTALVERWRQETHTFHFTVGESTVTLQDVAVLLGLRISGHVVTGNGDLQWDDLCEELLGVRPDRSVLHGSALKLSWLRSHFHKPPPDADDLTLQRYARAYILGLIGGFLFTDKSGADVQLIFLPLLRDFSKIEQLSWGSALLAYLYRELCRASKAGANEIAGPLILLQLWAWERLHIGRPERLGGRVRDPVVPDNEDVGNMTLNVGDATVDEEQVPMDPLGCRWRAPVIRRDNPVRALIFYRDQLDQQTDDEMIWQPYTPERLALLPDVCVKDQHLWRTMAPLICFDSVEWHHPDRVLRQFGLHQGIPKPCDTEVKLHSIDRRGRHHYDWRSYHGRYIQLWEACEESIAVGEVEEHPMHYHDPYMEWYRKVTRRLITPLTQRPHMRFQPSSGTTHLLVQSLTAIHNQCATTLGAFTGDCAMRAMTDIQTMCIRVLQMIGETRHLETRPSPTPASSTTNAAASSPPHTNNTEGPLYLALEEVAPLPATTQITTKAPSVRGRGRGKSQGRGRGRPRTSRAAVAAVTPESFLPPVIALAAALSRADDLEGPSYLNQKEAAPPEKSICMLEGEKVAEKAPPPPSEPTHPLDGEKEVDAAATQPQDGSREKLAELSEESSDVNRPKKKSKHF